MEIIANTIIFVKETETAGHMWREGTPSLAGGVLTHPRAAVTGNLGSYVYTSLKR